MGGCGRCGDPWLTGQHPGKLPEQSWFDNQETPSQTNSQIDAMITIQIAVTTMPQVPDRFLPWSAFSQCDFIIGTSSILRRAAGRWLGPLRLASDYSSAIRLRGAASNRAYVPVWAVLL